MKNYFVSDRVSAFIAIVLSVFFVMATVQATTIGTNITTGGVLTVSGTATSTFSTGGLTVGTSQFVVQQTSGNVGIGTTSPGTGSGVTGRFLTVQADEVIPAHGAVLQLKSSTIDVSNRTIGSIEFHNPAFNGGSGITRIADIFSSSDGLLGSNLRFRTTPDGGSTAERLRITGSGNIGINITTPTALFHISTTTPGMDIFKVTGGSQNLVYNSSGNLGIGTTSPYSKLSVAGQIVGQNFVATSTVTSSTFMSSVGIGTTTPTTKLHVSSGASATTTISIGELGLASSKACVNMNQADGSAGSFYITSGVIVVENNYCR